MSTPSVAPCLVIGAGLAGLSCAYHLQAPTTVLEAFEEVGGTARSASCDGYTFDVTGHWLHLRHASMRALVDAVAPNEFVEIERRAAIYAFGQQTRYPFQAHTYGLPAQVVADCLLGFFAAREARLTGAAPPPRSFADYVRQCMGEGIAKHFMLPYNRKLWTVTAEELAHTWCGRFVPLPTAQEVVWGALTPAGTGRALGYNATFLYPRTGGIDVLAKALARAIQSPLHLRAKVRAIDAKRRRVTCIDGRNFAYQQLVATLPLPALVAALVRGGHVPEAVQHAARKLRATQLTYWNVGFARPAAADAAHWTYYPEADVPFFRVGSPSAVRADLAPPGARSYYVETAHPQNTAAPADDAAILAGLRRVGLVAADEAPQLWQKHTLPCAYVIMDHAYGAARATILAWLGGQNIWPTGRFGAWTYDSMEGALLAGKEAAASVAAA